MIEEQQRAEAYAAWRKRAIARAEEIHREADRQAAVALAATDLVLEGMPIEIAEALALAYHSEEPQAIEEAEERADEWRMLQEKEE